MKIPYSYEIWEIYLPDYNRGYMDSIAIRDTIAEAMELKKELESKNSNDEIIYLVEVIQN